MFNSFGNVRINLPEVESTNAFAMELLSKQECVNGTLITTDKQTAGRGQRGTSWVSEPGKNLTFSIILKSIKLLPSQQFVLSKMVALALVNVLQEFGLDDNLLKIKWPNDIYYGNKKLAGILVENKFRGSKLESSVVGIGLNVNQKLFPEHIVDKTTSLFLILNNTIDLNSLLKSIMIEFEKGYFLLNSNSSLKALEAAYFNALYGKDFITYKVLDNNSVLTLKIIEVKSSGQIVMKSLDSNVHEFWFKEIELIKKAAH